MSSKINECNFLFVDYYISLFCVFFDCKESFNDIKIIVILCFKINVFHDIYDGHKWYNDRCYWEEKIVELFELACLLVIACRYINAGLKGNSAQINRLYG